MEKLVRVFTLKTINKKACFHKSNFFKYSSVQQNKAIENHKFLCTNNVTSCLPS